MNATALALLFYIAWFLLLFGAIAVLRAGLTASGRKQANSFKPDGSDVSEFSSRLCRAHANCYEIFPYIGGLMLFALATDLTEATNSFALLMVLARVFQSTVHIISTSVLAVQMRFVFFLIQFSIGIYWTIQLMGYVLQSSNWIR